MVLKKYADNHRELHMHILYAFQSGVHQLEHPPGVCLLVQLLCISSEVLHLVCLFTHTHTHTPILALYPSVTHAQMYTHTHTHMYPLTHPTHTLPTRTLPTHTLPTHTLPHTLPTHTLPHTLSPSHTTPHRTSIPDIPRPLPGPRDHRRSHLSRLERERDRASREGSGCPLTCRLLPVVGER